MNSLFWPRRKQHTIRMVQLLAPQSLRPELTSQLRLSLSLVNALRSVQDMGLDGLYLASELKKKIANSLSNASYFLQDDESRSAIGFIADELIKNVLAGDTVLFQQFIKKYCPHLIEGQESDFLFGMDMCDITLGYEQDELEGVQYGVQ